MRKQLIFSILAFIPIMVSASVKIGGIYYNLSSTTAAVTSNPSGYTGAIVIPSSINTGGNDYDVTSIEDGAFNNSSITEISIPSTVTQIGQTSSVFNGCNQLSRVNIPDLESWCRITFADNFYANPLSVALQQLAFFSFPIVVV